MVPIHHISNIKAARNNELQEIDIKNCTCYYLNSTININDLDLDYILLGEKSLKIFQISTICITLHTV